MKRLMRQTNRGESLIEILVAMMVVGLVLTALAAGMTMSIKTSSETRYQGIATNLAQEAVEFFERERAENGWQAFSTALQTTYCMHTETLPANINNLESSECEPEDTVEYSGFQFFRTAQVTKAPLAAPTEITIVVQVTWENSRNPSQPHTETVTKTFRQRDRGTITPSLPPAVEPPIITPPTQPPAGGGNTGEPVPSDQPPTESI